MSLNLRTPWLLRLIFIASVCICSIAAAQAQPAKETVVAFGGLGTNLVQAGDGNFYWTSLAIPSNCPSDKDSVCSYVWQYFKGINTKNLPFDFHDFKSAGTGGPTFPNTDGLEPTAMVLGIDGNLYGVCQMGGPGGFGTIWEIPLNGPDAGKIQVLKTFSSSMEDAEEPGGSPNALTQTMDGTFYFTNYWGVYRFNAASRAVDKVYEFLEKNGDGGSVIFPDGADPTSVMQGADGNLYVTLGITPGTDGDGSQGGQGGAIAQITASGALNILHALATNGSEGDTPIGPLVQGADGDFYGVTKWSNNKVGNTASNGVAFKVSVDHSYNVLHRFTGGADGGNPFGALILGSDGNFYGTTEYGGDTTSANCAVVHGCGAVFQLTPGGVLTTLYAFAGSAPNKPPVDTLRPYGALLQLNDGSFYGNAVALPALFDIAMTSALPAPIQISFKPKSIKAQEPVEITWKVLKAFSMTAQTCSASVKGNSPGAGAWTGLQQGVLAGGVYTGSATIVPQASGTYTYALTCGGRETGLATLNVGQGLQIDSTSLPDGLVNNEYRATLDASGGTEPYFWSATGLPKGLTISSDSPSGIVTGKPQQFGHAYATFTVVDSSDPKKTSPPVELEYTISAGLEITAKPAAKATVDAKYNDTPLTATGGLPDAAGKYKWKVLSGLMPPGISIDPSTGTLSGTPTKADTYIFTIEVEDYEDTPATKNATLTIDVQPAT